MYEWPYIYKREDPHHPTDPEGGTWEKMPTGTNFELVAISRGYAFEGRTSDPDSNCFLAEYFFNERPRVSDNYEWYNVFWVEWNDGIAYRKALGRVIKHVWEEQDLEPIRLMLG